MGNAHVSYLGMSAETAVSLRVWAVVIGIILVIAVIGFISGAPGRKRDREVRRGASTALPRDFGRKVQPPPSDQHPDRREDG
jgi:hypothetical protein